MMKNCKLTPKQIPTGGGRISCALAALVMSFVLAAPTVFAQGSTTRYVYDDNGRLRAVIAPNGEANIYEYDAAGNITAIRRNPASLLEVLGFTPSAGVVGAQVTIFGTGFSGGVTGVSFNGAAAQTFSVNAPVVTVTVPNNATTGPITVTTPTGSATSSQPFTVLFPPVVTSFTPTMGLAGTPVTVNGDHFEPTPTGNEAAFNITGAEVSAATTTMLATSVPTGATSGHISVTNTVGTGVSSADFFVPPDGYTVDDVEVGTRMAIGESKTVTINVTNKIALVLFDGTASEPPSPVGTITIGGSPVTVMTITPGQNAIRTFSGTANQRVSLRIDSTNCCYNIYILNPNGTTLVSGFSGSGGGFIDVQTLPVTGTYTILIDPSSNTVGMLTLTLYDVPPNSIGTISISGPPVTVTVLTPGQNATRTFSGTANQRVSLSIGSLNCCGDVYILNPNGTTLAHGGIFSSGDFIDVQTLPVTGTYTILIDPGGTLVGSLTLTLYNVPLDDTGAITIGGPPVMATIITPGQNAIRTFSGTANQRVSLRIDSTNCCYNIYILNPNGTTLTSGFISSSGGFFDAQTLPVTGVYTILIDPSNTTVGSLTLTLYDVPPDFTGTVSIGGAAVLINLTTPGRNATLTFNGTAGQQVTVRVTNNTMSCVAVALLRPNGTTLTSSFSCGSNFNLTTQTLSPSGTYTISIDPSGINTGSLNVSITSP